MKNQRQGNKSTCFVWDLFPCLLKNSAWNLRTAVCWALGLFEMLIVFQTAPISAPDEAVALEETIAEVAV